MRRQINTVLFVIIITIALITRIYKLGEIPHGLYLDEAAQGYNAYSILNTGKDEFGKAFPLVFRSFADFKTPIYTYLITPLIPLFGLTKFTIRFPSFFFGWLTLPLIYLLVKIISPKKFKNILGLITMLLLSISPWHILFSRTAFESNIALFFLITGLYFFYKGLEKSKYLPFSSAFFAIAITAYHAHRIIVPLLGLVLIVRHKDTLFSNEKLKYTIIGAALAFFILLPTLLISTTPGFLARASGLNIFSLKTQPGIINNAPQGLSAIINNKLYLSIWEFASLYAAYFSPLNLFSLGDYDLRTSFPEIATFYFWQLPFYLLGLYKIIKDKSLKELRFLTISLLVISPIPAAVTRDPYSSIRSLQMVIPLSIIISLGLIEFWKKFNIRLIKKASIVVFLLLIIYSLGKLYSSAIILNEYYRAREWDYGWEQVTESINTFDKNLPVIVDTARHGPHIELLFFLKYDPVKYSQDNFEVTSKDYYKNMDRRSTWDLGKIKVQPINWENDTAIKQYLIGDRLAISDEQIKEHGLTLIKDIYYPDGIIAFRIVKTNPD